jgi:hypothetical protein
LRKNVLKKQSIKGEQLSGGNAEDELTDPVMNIPIR